MSYWKFGIRFEGVDRMSIPQLIYRFRGYLAAPPLVFAFVFFSYETEVDWLIWPVGILIFLLGLALRIWAQQHLHYRLKVYKHLTTTGPYAFIRNPIYIGNTLICLGAIVVSELIWLLPITLFWCILIYSLVVRYEEVGLLAQYGESYRRYMLEVPRWFPRTIRFRNVGLMNEYFRASVLAEVHCLLVLLPYILKEFV